MSEGRYIVIEGPTGVGKTTQLQLLAKRLRDTGYPVQIFQELDNGTDPTTGIINMLIHDPRYPMSTRTEVLLYNAARSQSLAAIRKAREQGVICLCDRSYLTSLAVQYYGRGDVSDYDTITKIINFAVGDTQPDMTIVLDAPVAVLRERVRGQRGNIDEAFLERVRAGYLWEANERKFPVIFADKQHLKVAEEIWQTINGRMQQKVAKEAAPPVSIATPATPIKEVIEQKKEHLTEQKDITYVTKRKDGTYEITPDGKAFLSEAVTNSDSDVYGFTDKLSSTTIAAAMARLSRRGDDMRVTILDEFADTHGRDERLLQRVISSYGDDSVQQLVGQHLVVENASNLLTKKLEWGRLASYLEQSTRYIYFDQKDAKGRYRYFVPKGLSKAVRTKYIATMDEIFDMYSDMVRKLTEYVRAHSTVPEAERDDAFASATRAQACDAIRPVLPVATKATVGIYASGQALENLIMHLMSDELQEARETGEALLREARKVIPTFLERADKPDRGGATTAYRATTYKAVQEFTDKQIQQTQGSLDEDIQLVDYWPRNEFGLLPHMLYEHSNLSLKDLQKEINNWSYDQKTEAFSTYVGERLNRRQRPGRAMEIAHYTWDLICDYGIFRDLQRHRMVDSLEWQFLTARYGFDTPELIEEAGLSEQFESCFDKSAALYSLLQEKGHTLEAQYATLHGHRMRWKVTYNAREAFHLHELRTSPQGHPGYRKLVREMHDKLTEVHPLLGQSMKFVSKGEDEELTRLAAERYTQFKRNQTK